MSRFAIPSKNSEGTPKHLHYRPQYSQHGRIDPQIDRCEFPDAYDRCTISESLLTEPSGTVLREESRLTGSYGSEEHHCGPDVTMNCSVDLPLVLDMGGY